MTKNYLFIICFFASICFVFSQDLVDKNQNLDFNDGPYIFIKNNDLIQKDIINGTVITKKIQTDLYNTVFEPEDGVFNNVKKIAALSDIHGQFDLAVEILKNNKIIDQNLNWIFDDGHLVIVGDIFDRGDKVNEMLLLVYELENQAEMHEGKVHFLLGNHEYMVLHNDLRYVSKKYHKTCELLNLNYPDLYSNKTVIGRWLRSKPTMIKINNNVFVHGGISKEFLSHNKFDIERINNIMRSSLDRTKEEMKTTDFYSIYYGTNSLIWYRGYFNDKMKDEEVSQIMKLIETEHIVVGHCSNEQIVSLYEDKIFGVDSSIKKGIYGEILFIENNEYSRKTLAGKKEPF